MGSKIKFMGTSTTLNTGQVGRTSTENFGVPNFGVLNFGVLNFGVPNFGVPHFWEGPQNSEFQGRVAEFRLDFKTENFYILG